MLSDELQDILGEKRTVETENLIHLLTVSWINEDKSPELLKFQEQLLDKIMHQIEVQTQRMDGVDGFVSIVIQQELERIKYMVRSYLRTRLRKIECYCTFLLLDPAERDKMSDDELRYATKFRDLVSQYHTESFLNELPETLRSLDEPQMINKPDLDHAVLCQVLDDVGDVLISDRY